MSKCWRKKRSRTSHLSGLVTLYLAVSTTFLLTVFQVCYQIPWYTPSFALLFLSFYLSTAPLQCHTFSMTQVHNMSFITHGMNCVFVYTFWFSTYYKGEQFLMTNSNTQNIHVYTSSIMTSTQTNRAHHHPVSSPLTWQHGLMPQSIIKRNFIEDLTTWQAFVESTLWYNQKIGQ